MTAPTRGKHRAATVWTRWCDHCRHFHNRLTFRCVESGCSCAETGR